jgi:hypothetical protein
MTEPTLQQLVERFRELRRSWDATTHQVDDAGAALLDHIAEHGLPSWQDRPTCAGVWLDDDGDLIEWDEFCHTWEWGRVFGPVPLDPQRKGGERWLTD